MGVDHGRADVLVSEKLLDGTNVVPRLKQMRGEGVSKGVATYVLYQPGLPDCFLYSSLKNCLVQVMSPFLSSSATRTDEMIVVRFHPFPPRCRAWLRTEKKYQRRRMRIKEKLLVPVFLSAASGAGAACKNARQIVCKWRLMPFPAPYHSHGTFAGQEPPVRAAAGRRRRTGESIFAAEARGGPCSP